MDLKDLKNVVEQKALSWKGEQIKSKMKNFFEEHKEDIGVLVEIAWPYIDEALKKKVAESKTKLDDMIYPMIEAKITEILAKSRK